MLLSLTPDSIYIKAREEDGKRPSQSVLDKMAYVYWVFGVYKLLFLLVRSICTRCVWVQESTSKD